MEKINKIIDEIPEEYNGIKIMSSLMKNFYKTFLNEDTDKFFCRH